MTNQMYAQIYISSYSLIVAMFNQIRFAAIYCC